MLNVLTAKLGPTATRAMQRMRRQMRTALKPLQLIRGPLSFALLLASVGMVMFSSFLLDDLVSRAQYLNHPSPDAVTISEPIVISDQPMLTLASGSLSVPPSRSGQARTADALAALVKGGGARLALMSPVIALELSPRLIEDGDESASAALSPELTALSPLLVALLDATFETLTIRDGTIALKSGGGRVDMLTNVSADVSVKRKTAVRFKGAATLNGEVLNFDATFGARIGRRGNARMPVRAQIQCGLLSVSIDGRLDVNQGLALLASNVDISAPNVRSIARWFGHMWPSGPGLKDFAAHGTAEWNGQSIVFQKGTFHMDGNEATGALSLNFAAERPALAGTLALQTANVTPYAFDPRDGAFATTGMQVSSLIGLFKATRDPTLSLIGAFDADVRISAEAVTFGKLEAGRSAFSLALRDGQLLLDLAEMTLRGGGDAAGELAITGSRTTPDYAVHGRINGADLADLSSLLAGTVMVAGHGDVVFDLKASGGAGIDVLSRMSGRIEVAMPNGGIARCALRELEALRDGCHATTVVEPFKAAFIAANGIIITERAEAVTGYDRTRIEGTMDLVTSTMDLKISSGVSADGATGGAETRASIPVRNLIVVRGRSDGPQITVRTP